MTSCIRCGIEKPDSEFYAHPMMASGHLNKCKSCCKEQAKGYGKVWRANNTPDPEKARRHEARRKAKARDGRLNREELKAKQRVDQHFRWLKWYEKRQRETAYDRAVVRDGKLTSEERAAIRRIRKNEQYRDWAERNPKRRHQHAKASSIAYQARRRGASGRASTDQLAARWAYYADRCWMCGDPATQTDHVIPLSRGGSNWASNLRPACGPCNREKWDTLVPI